MTNTNKLLADFNRYFTSGNDVDVPERVSVPRDEWRELHAALAQPAQPSHAVAAIRARLAQEEGQVPKRSDKQDDDFASGLWSGLRIALEMLEAEAKPARVVDAFGVMLSDEVIEAATLAHEESNCHDLIGPMGDAMRAAVECAKKLSIPTAAPTHLIAGRYLGDGKWEAVPAGALGNRQPTSWRLVQI